MTRCQFSRRFGHRRQAVATVLSLFALSSSSSLLPLATVAAADVTERRALELLYISLHGDNWKSSDNWNADAIGICQWEGVECEEEENAAGGGNDAGVVAISLPANNLVGTISPHLYVSLPKLMRVDFMDNGIVGGGWDGIDSVQTTDGSVTASLSPIQVLELTSNKLSSVEGIEHLKNSLTELHMSYNLLRGVMPSELFVLDHLRILAISENGLEGPIDPRLGQLTHLREVYCYGNAMTGEIPTEIGELSKLKLITFAENKLTGPLPAEIGNIQNLETFSVHNKELYSGAHTGPLPAFDKHPFLTRLLLDGNSFTGSIPHTFMHVSNTTDQRVTVGLSNNELTGTVPRQLLKFSMLDLDVVGNNITGIDDAICQSDKVDAWMGGDFANYGCNSILCPIGTYTADGRQTLKEAPCGGCDAGTGDLMGAMTCASTVDIGDGGGSDETGGTPDAGPMLEEAEILAEFYLAVGGKTWAETEGWKLLETIDTFADLTLPAFATIDHCTFMGVTCDPSTGRVTAIVLRSNNLEGVVPASLFDLVDLAKLDLAGNELRLDREYGFGEIGNAKSLVYLDLSSNDIESFKGLGKAVALQELRLDDSYLFNKLDTEELYQLKNLHLLHIQYSGLRGSIPAGISALKELKAINFLGNEMGGSIPDEIGQLTNLWHIDLSENSFNGPLPAEALKKLLLLQKLHVHQSGRIGSGITGELPSFLEQKELHLLSVSSNTMTGIIPSDFLANIENVNREMVVDLGYNEFTGTIPAGLKRFTDMKLTAIMNQIVLVAPELCGSTGWMSGEVGKVNDGGGSGCDAILCPKGTYNDYGKASHKNSGVCQTCEGGSFAGMTTCDGIDYDFFKVNDDRKILLELYTATSGKNWENSTKWLAAGENVCDYEGVTCTDDAEGNQKVETLNLSGKGLMGNIPTSIYELPSLKSVDFSNNLVSLSFDGIEKATNLENIEMADADLSDFTNIEKAASLKKLHVARNSFNGTIPENIFSLSSLVSLSIAYNGFNGPLPPSISGMSSLKQFWAGGNQITGKIPEEISLLSNLDSLVLAGNRMTGLIPGELEVMDKLKTLHLHNQREYGGFSGPLPTFKASPHLHDLDFSRNSLTGSIPSSFLATVRDSPAQSDFAFVEIDLSYNSITGAIPTDFDDFVGLFLDLAGNKISEVPNSICDDDDEFMNGLEGQLDAVHKCDAILCPKGTFAPEGRMTTVDSQCTACPGSTEELRIDQAPYFGSVKCDAFSAEKIILEKLYNLLFTEESNQKYWLTDNPICNWYGITCSTGDDAASGVIAIDWESNGLETDDPDTVSSLLFDLPFLQSLSLRGNEVELNLQGISNAQNLEVLQISATGLTSVAGIGGATKLRELHLTQNLIAGKFPEEIFDLTNMEKLYLSFNQITGTIPKSISKLTKLVEFFAYTNSMTGPIPAEIGSLTTLEYLVLGQNKFSGPLPTQLNNLVNLKELSFYMQEGDESLNGKLLDFAQMTQLASFDVEGNKFTGSIPETFLSGLKDSIKLSEDPVTLHLADNMLTGTLPQGLEGITNLYIEITGNMIEGPIPSSFCAQTLWMEGLVGELNSCNAIACQKGYFSETGRQKSASDADKCKPCTSLNLAPYLGSTFCRQDVAEKNILKSLYDLLGGDSWTTKENWMDETKPICSWYGVTCSGGSDDSSGVTELSLGSNNLDGTVPTAIYELPLLEFLDLRLNNVHLTFYDIYKANLLEVLYISSIDIADVTGIGKAPALREIHLTGNNLSGEFPEEFFDLDSLEQLYIAYNSFTGTLSKKFGMLSKLTDLYAYDNDFSGTIPSEIAQLTNLKNLVLAENLISGNIPAGFGSMPSLKLFSVYRRLKAGPKLTGSLPSFANAPQLEGLFLDYNHLTGPIPANFLEASLKTQLITISHNFITGAVPIGLDSFDNLNIEMEGNKISDLDIKFCDNDLWMNKAVGLYDCNAILCPPHHYSTIGRQNSTDTECKKCPQNEDSTAFWGSIACEVGLDEKDILEILYNRCEGKDWYNQENWMTSSDICTWHGVDCGDGNSIIALRLGSNNLQGVPPEEIFGLGKLHTLWLHSNPIAFSFKGIEKAKNLAELRLDSTGLTDIYGVGKGLTLKKLDLNYNRISGAIPAELFELEDLEVLSITDNRLTGTLPPKFVLLSNIQALRLGSNEISGPLYSFDNMEYLQSIDLSDNLLTGTIPEQFLGEVSKRKAITVDLSSNKLSGSVPLSLDEFEELTIYLRDNEFTDLSPLLCDGDNDEWFSRDVNAFKCNAILCPPGTYNFLGRQSSATTPCEKCDDASSFYGQVKCGTITIRSSASSLGGHLAFVALLITGAFQMYM